MRTSMGLGCVERFFLSHNHYCFVALSLKLVRVRSSFLLGCFNNCVSKLVLSCLILYPLSETRAGGQKRATLPLKCRHTSSRS